MKAWPPTFTGLLLLTLAATALGADTRISGPDGRTRAYIDDRGRISAPDGKTLGYVERNGRVSRPDGSTAGYLQDSGDYLNKLQPERGSGSHTGGRRDRD